MRTVYLSPHLDDAAISAGGYIRSEVNSGRRVEIWTCMAGIPPDAEPSEFARFQHELWGFGSGVEAMQARRREDLAAAGILGAASIHLDFLDCIYRRGGQGQALYSDITLPVQPDDADLPEQIARTVAARLLPDDRVVCQFGVGDHVDHVIVRRAAERLHRRLVYAADLPYALIHPEELQPHAAGLQGVRAPVSAADFACWMRAIECYASQLVSVFGGRTEMLARMQAFWDEQHGIELWSLPEPA